MDTKADKSAQADLRAKLHRTMAALIEAQSAEEPDQGEDRPADKHLPRQLRDKASPSTRCCGQSARGWELPAGRPRHGIRRWRGVGRSWPRAGQGIGVPDSAPVRGAGRALAPVRDVGRVAVEAMGMVVVRAAGPAEVTLLMKTATGFCDYY